MGIDKEIAEAIRDGVLVVLTALACPFALPCILKVIGYNDEKEPAMPGKSGRK